jgi:hypothetical protein
MNRAIARQSSPIVVSVEQACHAGGRGFESRRSRKVPATRHVSLPGEAQCGNAVASEGDERRMSRTLRLTGPRSRRPTPRSILGGVVRVSPLHARTAMPTRSRAATGISSGATARRVSFSASSIGRNLAAGIVRLNVPDSGSRCSARRWPTCSRSTPSSTLDNTSGLEQTSSHYSRAAEAAAPTVDGYDRRDGQATVPPAEPFPAADRLPPPPLRANGPDLLARRAARGSGYRRARAAPTAAPRRRGHSAARATTVTTGDRASVSAGRAGSTRPRFA